MIFDPRIIGWLQMVDEKRKQEMEILSFEERHQKQEDLLKSVRAYNNQVKFCSRWSQITQN